MHSLKITISAICASVVLSLQAQEIAMPLPMEQKPQSRTYPAVFALKPGYPIAERIASYKSIKLTADISGLKPEEKEALHYMIEAAKHADNIFWMQAYGEKDSVLTRAADENVKRFLMMNYGPWDRLNNNESFISGIGEKPDGACFYPPDMTKAEYDSTLGRFTPDPYAIVTRNPMGRLEQVPYFMAYNMEIAQIRENLMKAADAIDKTGDKALSDYLRQRAESLMMNNYMPSDIAWLNVKNSNLDLIIGPIETYEDKLNGVHPAFEAYVLVRDKEWGKKLEKYISFLPELQKNLPVDTMYKREKVNNKGSQLAVFDAIYYAGDCNAGSKTIAVNLPNDEFIQKEHGTRRSQLKNVMKAKFDNMVVPISEVVMDPSQRANITFDAFFNNVMFHEVAHGLGIKNVIHGSGTVKDALGSNASSIEECKADVLGLYMVTQLVDKKELKGNLDDFYITFTASVFRSVRFGGSSDHGRANMITFNTLLASGAVVRQNNGTYKVDVPIMRKTIERLAGELLVLQGNGDNVAVQKYLDSKAVVSETLKQDLNRINKAGIPVDIVFEQGKEVLGLQ